MIRVLSIKSVYADRIRDGSKTIELRRRPTGISVGDLVLLYEVEPDSVIRSGFTAGNTISPTVDEMWDKHSEKLGINEVDYRDYFFNCICAYGTNTSSVFEFPPMALSELRDKFQGFTPPQSILNWRMDWDVPIEWSTALIDGRQALLKEKKFDTQLGFFDNP